MLILKKQKNRSKLFKVKQNMFFKKNIIFFKNILFLENKNFKKKFIKFKKKFFKKRYSIFINFSFNINISKKGKNTRMGKGKGKIKNLAFKINNLSFFFIYKLPFSKKNIFHKIFFSKKKLLL